MVVIVIVTLLASIAFTVASRARTKANSMQCMSRVREWGAVMLQANNDLGGGRMYCPQNFMSIGPNESPFTLYWAEAAGLSGSARRNQLPAAEQYEYDREYKAKIAKRVQEVRSCPCIHVGPNDYGNSGSSYSLNTYLQEPGSFSNGATTRFPLTRLGGISRPSKKIYMMDCGPNGAMDFRKQGKSKLVNGVREIQDSHGGKVNALFLDMHIEQISADQLENEWRALTQR